MQPRLQALRDTIRKTANQQCWNDGGNIDDAFDGGVNQGEILFARRILKHFFDENVANDSTI